MRETWGERERERCEGDVGILDSADVACSQSPIAWWVNVITHGKKTVGRGGRGGVMIMRRHWGGVGGFD